MLEAKNVIFPLVKTYEEQLSQEDLVEIHSLANRGEWGEALVDFCARVAEHKIVLDPFDLMIMDDLAQEMKLDIVELKMIHDFLEV